MAAVGRPTRERAALSVQVEAGQVRAADHVHDFDVFEQQLALLHAFVSELRVALARRRREVESDQRELAREVNELCPGVVHPSLLGPESKKAAGDTATLEDTDYEEAISA